MWPQLSTDSRSLSFCFHFVSGEHYRVELPFYWSPIQLPLLSSPLQRTRLLRTSTGLSHARFSNFGTYLLLWTMSTATLCFELRDQNTISLQLLHWRNIRLSRWIESIHSIITTYDFIYICIIYMFIYIHIHTYIHTQVYIHINIYTHIYVIMSP